MTEGDIVLAQAARGGCAFSFSEDLLKIHCDVFLQTYAREPPFSGGG